jgi:hypothetical protein
VFHGFRLNEIEKLVLHSLNMQGDKMGQLEEKLDQLKASTEAAFTRASTDLEALRAKIDQMGQLSPEVSQLIDGMVARADAFDVNNPPPPDGGGGVAPPPDGGVAPA